MSETTMIERVARASAKFDARPFDRLGRADKARYLSRARLEIEAMREPTSQMETAFYAACDEHGHVLWRYGYRAMVDAALVEQHPAS